MPDVVVMAYISRHSVERRGRDYIYFVAGYKDGDAWRQRSFHSHDAAYLFLQSIGQNDCLPAKATFANVAERYLSACACGRSDGFPLETHTVRTYRNYLNNHLIPLLGDRYVSSIQRADCRMVRDALVARLKSRNSARQALCVFRSVVKFAVEEDLLAFNPAHLITIKSGSGRYQRPISERLKVHSKSEMRRILAVLESWRSADKTSRARYLIYAPFIYIGIYCGLRISEIIGLERSAVDLEMGTLEVRQRVSEGGRVGPVKTARSLRQVPMPDFVTDQMQVLLNTQDHRFVFPNKRGGPLHYSNFMNRLWYPLQRHAEVSILGFHATRHFYASRLIEQGANLKELQVLLGHSDPTFTLRVYGHLFAESLPRLKELANRVVLSPDDQRE